MDEIKEDCDLIIIMGDWNARIGKYQNRRKGCRERYGDETNRNGGKMLTFCQENDLLTENTFWNQSIEERYTFWAEESNAKSIIDYMIYTRPLQKYIK